MSVSTVQSQGCGGDAWLMISGGRKSGDAMAVTSGAMVSMRQRKRVSTFTTSGTPSDLGVTTISSGSISADVSRTVLVMIGVALGGSGSPRLTATAWPF